MPIKLFPNGDETAEALKYIMQVADEHPEIPIGDYFNIYKPHLTSNECCYRCWKASHSACAWAKNFEAVEGSISANLSRSNGNTEVEAYKIFYCPEFQADNQMPQKEREAGYNEEGCVNVLCAIAKEIAEDYRATLIEIKRLRALYIYKTDKGFDANKKVCESILEQIYWQLMHKRDIEENVMPAHCNALQRQIGYKEIKYIDLAAVKHMSKKGKK